MWAPLSFHIFFAIYGVFVLGDVAATVLGLIAGPRPWIRRQCKWTLWISGIFLLLLAGTLLVFTLAATLRGDIETAPLFFFIIILCFPLLCAFLGLLAVWFCCMSTGTAFVEKA